MAGESRAPSAVVLAVVLAVAGLLAGCAGAPPPAPAAPPPRPDAVTACGNQLTYWVGEELRGAPDAGFDYQEKGLTGAQADALAVLVDEARARGGDPPPDWVASRARELCTAIVAEPQPTDSSWP